MITGLPAAISRTRSRTLRSSTISIGSTAHDHRAFPLRITLGGGGTDLPSYYREQGGFLIAAAIDKYVYITVHQTFINDLIVKYSELERVGSIDELKHPIVREAFKVVGLDVHSLEIT